MQNILLLFLWIGVQAIFALRADAAVMRSNDRFAAAVRNSFLQSEAASDSASAPDSLGQSGEEAQLHSARSYFYEPYPLESGSSVFQLGISFSMQPEPIVEQEIPFPALDVQFKHGIAENISLVASLSTNIYSNLLHTGIQWNTNAGRFSLGLAGHVGGVYGFITEDKLFDDVHGYAAFLMPIVRFGYRLDDFAISTSFVATYLFASGSYVNGVPSSAGPKNTVNDLFCTIAVEQPFINDVQVCVGLSLGYARTPYQSWMLYNTLDEWLFVPEFFFSVQL